LKKGKSDRPNALAPGLGKKTRGKTEKGFGNEKTESTAEEEREEIRR